MNLNSKSTTPPKKTLVAFHGHKRVARGSVAKVVRKCKALVDEGLDARLAIFDADTGRAFDVEFEGTPELVLQRATAPEVVAPKKPGRPKLGVTSKEVSLLPDHWEWLSAQRGGASATIRRLVHEARRASAGSDGARSAIDAAHRFIWDIAGDMPNFEDVTRAFYRDDLSPVDGLVADWPKDIREQLTRFLAPAHT